jgi:hypothetical protein
MLAPAAALSKAFFERISEFAGSHQRTRGPGYSQWGADQVA